jgi:hypothetical protein
MSSRPSPAGAAKAIELIDQVAALNDEEARLQRTIDAVQPHVERLQKVRVERAGCARQLGEHLRSMDVDSPGNCGWEGRFAWLLGEVLRQARGGTP